MIDPQDVLDKHFTPQDLGRLYKVGHQFVFALHSPISHRSISICYLINRIGSETERGKWFRYAVEFPVYLTETQIVEKFQKALQVPKDKYLEYDADGGDLGREENNPV